MIADDTVAETDDRRAAAPRSVLRVLRILEALCASPDPLTLADLGRLLETPKSSLAALLRGLAEEGYVLSVDGGWRLGPGAFGLGSALAEARRRLQSSDLIRDGMRRLADVSGETVLLGVADTEQGTMTYVDVVETSKAVRYAVSVGEQRPLYATSGGRMLLSFCSREAVEAYLKRTRPQRHTPHTQTDRAKLLAEVDKARENGFAQTMDQTSDGLTGTAALIRDASRDVVGALVLAVPTARAQERLAELAQMVQHEAAAISRALGFR